jgi:hypothetical protein
MPSLVRTLMWFTSAGALKFWLLSHLGIEGILIMSVGEILEF